MEKTTLNIFDYELTIETIYAPNRVYDDGAKRGCHTESTFKLKDSSGKIYEGAEKPKKGSAWEQVFTLFNFTKVEILSENEVLIAGIATTTTDSYSTELQRFVDTQQIYPVEHILKRVE